MHYPPAHLETERLNIRPLTINDVAPWQVFVDNKEAMRFMDVYFPPTLANRAQAWIEFQLRRYAENRYGFMALEDKQTGKLVGMSGLLLEEIDGKTEIEVGYHILPEYWGKGYAPNAAAFFVNYAFDNNIATSLISIIDEGNNASVRVAKKLGFSLDKELEENGNKIYIYRKDK